MALDTKVPDGQPEGRMDGQRQNNIPPPLAGDNKLMYLLLLKTVNITNMSVDKVTILLS